MAKRSQQIAGPEQRVIPVAQGVKDSNELLSFRCRLFKSIAVYSLSDVHWKELPQK
jgi:hypothetical protein